jgi:uncharacterized peroxidase-related enzyme
MPFIATVDPEAASGAVREIYEADRARLGYVPNFTRLFSVRPEVYKAWGALVASIRDDMDLRRYELATIAAAAAMRCSYCVVAHGAVLASRFFTPEEVVALARDFRSAGLEPVDVAVMELAQKVALDAYKVTEEDVARLRAFGLDEREVFDVVLTAAARAFFSKSLDSMGAEADDVYVGQLGAGMVSELSIGRPFPMSMRPVD